MPVTRIRPVRFGVQLPPQRTTWPEYAATVQAVEAMGYDTLWNSDHLWPWCGDPGDPSFSVRPGGPAPGCRRGDTGLPLAEGQRELGYEPAPPQRCTAARAVLAMACTNSCRFG